MALPPPSLEVGPQGQWRETSTEQAGKGESMAVNWRKPLWINDELVMEEARRRERNGEGRVIDDGIPPARWVPKQKGAHHG
jgi:hypothetical protein